MAQDGAWCWFSDPRSVFYKGKHERTYTGFVSSTGDILVSAQDHRLGEVDTQTICKGLETDDHVNPSILFLPDGRLMIFFTRHGGALFYTTSKAPEDISGFETIDSLNLGNRLCYTNPVLKR